MKAEYEPENVSCMDHLVSVFRQRNIEVIFVTSPVWHTYQEAMSKECWDETLKIVAQRTKDFHLAYYCRLNMPELKPQDFKDVIHLRPSGSDFFTKSLDLAIDERKPFPLTPNQ